MAFAEIYMNVDMKKNGLQAVSLPDEVFMPRAPVMVPPIRKRKADEILDSEDEDEDYGWAEEDAENLPQATQNQGSEDILVAPELDDEDNEHNGEVENTSLAGTDDDDNDNDETGTD